MPRLAQPLHPAEQGAQIGFGGGGGGLAGAAAGAQPYTGMGGGGGGAQVPTGRTIVLTTPYRPSLPLYGVLSLNPSSLYPWHTPGRHTAAKAPLQGASTPSAMSPVSIGVQVTMGGGLRGARGGGTCWGSLEGPCARCGRGGGGGGQAVSTVLTRGRWLLPKPRRPLQGATGSPGLVFRTRACTHPTLLVHHPEGGAKALSCGATDVM